MIPSKQHTGTFNWKRVKLSLLVVLCSFIFSKSYAQYYSFKTEQFADNQKRNSKKKYYTSNASINGIRWEIKSDAKIRSFDNFTSCLKVGTSSNGASYLTLKPTLNISKIRKIVISIETSESENIRNLLNSAISSYNKEISPVKSYINDSIIFFTFENIVLNENPEIKIFYDKNKTYFIAVQSIEVTNEIGQKEDNSTTITSNKDIENNIIQVTRTLSKNYWNTFCLPFNVDKDSVKLHLNNPELREFTGKVDGTTMLFKDATEIKAGVPYIIKPTENVENPTFRNVTITEVEPKTITDETGNYAFVGAYSPTELKIDGTELFLGDKDNLYKPSTNDKKINGMRAFFRIKNASHAKQSQYNISLDGTTTIVLHNTNDIPSKTHERVYTLDGRQVYSTSNLKTGIYIKNGRKIYVN